MDALGLKGDRSVSMIGLAAPGMKMGDILEVWGDCPTFEPELRFWCRCTKRTLLSVEDAALMKKIQIRF
jgi:TusA-related sulfurtransferase